MSYEAKITALKEERAQLWADSQKILERAEEEERNLNEEESTNWQKAHEDMKVLDEKIERLEEQRQRDDYMNQPERVVAGQPDTDADDEDDDAIAASRSKHEAEVFSRFMRFGINGLTPEDRAVMVNRQVDLTDEQRAQAAGTDTAGGFSIPQGPFQQAVSARLRFGGMRRARTTQFNTSDSRDLPIPTDNDTSNTGALLAENTQVTEQDVAIGQVVLHGYTYTSKLVRVSLKLLRDTAFDFDSWLANKLGMRIGRILNTHFTTGDGASKPYGVVTQATLGVTGAATGDVTLDELYELKHSVDPDYREEAEWMFNDNSLLKLKQKKDGEGRTLWQPGMAVGEPSTIDGDPYVVNQDMASMATTAKAILYGAFENYYIRDVAGMNLLRLEERYADFLQVGFLAFSDHDGVLVDAGTNPIKYFQNA